MESTIYEGNFTVNPGTDTALNGEGTITAEGYLKFRGEGSSDTFVKLTSRQTSDKLISFPIINKTSDSIILYSTSDVYINKNLSSITNTAYAKAFRMQSDAIFTLTTSTPTSDEQVLTYTGSDLVWKYPVIINLTGQVQYNFRNGMTGAPSLYLNASDSFPVISNITSISDVTVPRLFTDGLTLFSIFNTGRSLLCQNDKNMAKTIPIQPYFQPGLASNRISLWSALGGNTTTIYQIDFETTTTGTITAVPISTAADVSMSRKIGYATAATAGSIAGIIWGQLLFCAGNSTIKGGYYYVARIDIIPQVNQNSWFAGLTSLTTISGSQTPSSLTNIIGFGKDRADAAATTYFIYNGSATATKVLLPGNVITSATGMTELRIYKPRNNNIIYYSAQSMTVSGIFQSGIITDTLGTNQPALTTLLAPQIYVNTGVNISIRLDVSIQYMETTY